MSLAQTIAPTAEDYILEMTGELHGVFFERILAYHRLDQDGRAAEREKALGTLISRDLLTEAEANGFRGLLDAMTDARSTLPEMVSRVQDLGASLESRDASPLARSIAAVATDSLEREMRQAGPQPRGSIAHADVDGALVGAILGAELAVPGGVTVLFGAGVGGLVGAVASSVAEAA